jgi:hypothetical protein
MNCELAYYDTMRERLQQRLGESMDNPRHFEKAHWFAKYWNDRPGDVTPLMKRTPHAFNRSAQCSGRPIEYLRALVEPVPGANAPWMIGCT